VFPEYRVITYFGDEEEWEGRFNVIWVGDIFGGRNIYNELVFTNELGLEVDPTELTDFLLTVEGVGEIESLVISFSSQSDLRTVRASLMCTEIELRH
jgi:hypothetical protein